jgi:hypothetical protein
MKSMVTMPHNVAGSARMTTRGSPKIEADVGLEINLHDRNAVQRLRLHVLDAGYVGTHRVLAIGRDSLLHLRRAKAAVLPDHRHHRNVDFREDILRHDPDSGDADKDDEGGQNVKGVRKFQRKSDDTHVVILTAGGSSSFSDSLQSFKTRSSWHLNVHQEIDFDKLVQIAYTVRYSA